MDTPQTEIAPTRLPCGVAAAGEVLPHSRRSGKARGGLSAASGFCPSDRSER